MLPLRYSHGLATSCLIPTRPFLLLAFLLIDVSMWSNWHIPCFAGEPKGPLASFGEKRTFSDKSGKFKIEGKLKFADAKAAQILKPDGKVVTVPFDKLSPADGQIVPEFQFTGGGGAWDELHWMAFLPNNRFATISQKHHFTIWDLENKLGPKALKQGSTGNSLTASMTPAGELMAFISGNSIAVVETSEGKLVGAIQQESPCSSVAFSSDATMLAAFRPFQVTLYSTKDGKEIRTLPVSQE